ncbi:hypothetical protein PCI56_20825 [Plesiomonas shigelloides subsp. oncorhynchi]|nr:hypothetical protein [Plesiomonas shigelloides]
MRYDAGRRGSLTLIVSGLHVSDLPAYSLGYVYLPALACIAVTSVQTSKVGANLVSRLPVPILKRDLPFFWFLSH